MSNSNQPPFEVGQKVVAIRNSDPYYLFDYKKGHVDVVYSIEQFLGHWCMELESKKDGWKVDCRNFAPYNPYSNSVTAELAEKAMNVGDTADQPVKEIVNNN